MVGCPSAPFTTRMAMTTGHGNCHCRSRLARGSLRPDQESQPAWHLERLRIHGPVGGGATSRTRVARGADAVPLADADPSAGWREPNCLTKAAFEPRFTR